MRVVEVAVHEGDGDAFIAFRGGPLERGAQGGVIENANHCPVGAHPLVRLDHPGVERRGLDDVEGEQLRPGLIADLERIGEAGRGDKQGPGPGALQQGVGGHGRAELDRGHPRRRKRRSRGDAEQATHALNGGVGIVARRRWQFERAENAVRRGSDHIGEGAAAINPEGPEAGGVDIGHQENVTCAARITEPPKLS